MYKTRILLFFIQFIVIQYTSSTSLERIENNEGSFIVLMSNTNSSLSIFNHVVCLLTLETGIMIPYKSLASTYLQLNKYGVCNIENSCFKTFWKKVWNGLCFLRINNMVFYKPKQICIIYRQVLKVFIIKDLLHLRGELHTNIILTRYISKENIYGNNKFSLFVKENPKNKHFFGTAYRSQIIKPFGRRIRLFNFLTYKVGRYIGGGIGRTAYRWGRVEVTWLRPIVTYKIIMGIKHE